MLTKIQLTQNNDRGGSISHFLILSTADLNHGLGSRVLDLDLQVKIVSGPKYNHNAQRSSRLLEMF